jgi:hypothetical protein
LTISNAGTYVVTVTNANGCTDTESFTVTSVASPNAGINTPSTTFCIGGSAVLTGTGGGTYAWSTGATTPTITVTSAGTYTVTVTGSNGCTDVETVSMSQIAPPVAGFTWSPSLLVVSFSNASTGTSGFCNYNWNFGDGGTSGSQFPTHTYSSPGTYTVSLIVDCQGCRDTTTQVIEVFLTGVEDGLANSQLAIYPNPFSGNLHFDLGLAKGGMLDITMVDALGRVVAPLYHGEVAAGDLRMEWDAPANLANGVYFAQIKLGEEIIRKKIVLSR